MIHVSDTNPYLTCLIMPLQDYPWIQKQNSSLPHFTRLKDDLNPKIPPNANF